MRVAERSESSAGIAKVGLADSAALGTAGPRPTSAHPAASAIPIASGPDRRGVTGS
jgi:hypothetical protein